MNGEIPVLNFGFGGGAGSQREKEELSYLPMPRDMHTFEIPSLPEPEAAREAPDALALLERLQGELEAARAGERGRILDLGELSEAGLNLLYQVFGEGEVAIQVYGERPARIQETVLAGVWWIQQLDRQGSMARQWLEVADVPALVLEEAFAAARWPELDGVTLPGDLQNALPVLTELLDVARAQAAGSRAGLHVTNLSLLPFSPADHAFLDQCLGEGSVRLLSRGYGNCRILSTATPGIWRVQYFNSTDALILDTLEVTEIPQVACAAAEDLEDSAARLLEIREALA